MNNINKEVYYEGWLIKSPPQRIWKAVSIFLYADFFCCVNLNEKKNHN